MIEMVLKVKSVPDKSLREKTKREKTYILILLRGLYFLWKIF